MDTKKPTGDEANARERMTSGSMCRSIYCDGCNRLFVTADGEGQSARSVRGRARSDYRCDFCNQPLPQGGLCFAFSVYERPEDYRRWEFAFLTDPVTVHTNEHPTSPSNPKADEEPSPDVAQGGATAPPVWSWQAGKRCRLQGHSPTVTVIVGWDRPLQTYFAQVWDTPPGAAHYEDGKLLLWLGTAWEEVCTVSELANAVKAHATIPQDLQKLLGEFSWRESIEGDRGDWE